MITRHGADVIAEAHFGAETDLFGVNSTPLLAVFIDLVLPLNALVSEKVNPVLIALFNRDVEFGFDLAEPLGCPSP